MVTGKSKVIRSVAGEKLGEVGPDVFTGWCAWVPTHGGWFKVAEQEKSRADAMRKLRNWVDMRPDQQDEILHREANFRK